MTSDKVLQTMIKNAEQTFFGEIDKGSVRDAKDADERASEIAATVCDLNGFDNDSGEYESIVSALFVISGESFPGDW